MTTGSLPMITVSSLKSNLTICLKKKIFKLYPIFLNSSATEAVYEFFGFCVTVKNA